MINNVTVEGYVAKISNFVYAGDKTGVHFDLGHQVYHGKTENSEAHYTSEFFHCVALGGMVKRILAKRQDGSPLIEVGTRMTVSGKLTVRKNKKGEVTYENVSIVVTDFSVSGKKPKAEEASAPASAFRGRYMLYFLVKMKKKRRNYA